MNDLLVTMLGGGYPVELLLKATLVLGAAGVAAICLQRAPAATRHLVWVVGVSGLILLPLLSTLLPSWDVPVAAELPESTGTVADRAATAGGLRLEMSSPSSSQRMSVTTGTPKTASAQALPPAAEASEAAPAGSSWPLLLLGIWAAGSLLLLVRLAVGSLGIRRLARDAEPITDPEWRQLLKDATWLLDVNRDVRLLQSPRSSMPMTWGTRRPTIMIPAEASQWPTQRRRVVLLHEMAHVARGDCLTQKIADLACALYWFHPLAWVAARRLRVERERACDDRVLTAGERASDYAGHLLEVARAYRGMGVYSAAAIGMARPSQLEGRLLAVLDQARKRGSPDRRTTRLGVALAVLLLLPLAAIQASQAQAEEEKGIGLLSQLRGAISASTSDFLVDATNNLIDLPGQISGETAVDTVIDLEVAAQPGGTVRIQLPIGGSVQVAGWEQNAVSVHAELGGRYTEGASVDLTSADGVVTLSSEYEGSPRGRGRADFRLRVPARSNIDVATGGGAITIEGVNGRFTGRTGGGAIRLANLTGEAILRTGGGSISVSDSRLDGEVTTGGGNVTIINNQGGLQGRTGGGSIRIEGPEGAALATAADGDITRISTGGGDITLRDIPAGADLNTGGGDITVRSAGGPVVARTGGGDIRIDAVNGDVDAQTGGGDVTLASVAGSSLLRTGAGDVRVVVEGGPGARNVDVQTGSGSVTLYLPMDYSGEFEVLMDARGSRSQAALQSDVPLTREVTTTNGRNTLRATGRLGTGANRVLIRTATDDVEIRLGRPVALTTGSSSSSSSRSSSAASSRSSSSSSSSSSSASSSDDAFDFDFDFDFDYGPELDRAIDRAVEAAVAASLAGIGPLTADITEVAIHATIGALQEAVDELETLEAAGRLTAEQRDDLADLREGIEDLRAETNP